MRFVVWGSGEAIVALVREGEPADGDAVAVARRRCRWTRENVGVELDPPHTRDGWCVEVYGTTDEVDAATRGDPAVWGWASLPDLDQVRGLRAAGHAIGDLAQVAVCNRALEGDPEAFADCADVIADAGANG